jgi:polyisoprenoid-binding protein YceI
MRRQIFGALSVLCILIALTAYSAEYKIDPTHSNIGFTIRHLVSHVSGQFTAVDGTLTFDPGKMTQSMGKFSVKVASVSTNNPKRDAHLKSEDFFYAEKYPELSFVIKKVVPNGKTKAKMSGDLTMRGVTKPVTFDVEYLGSGKSMNGKPIAGFVGSTVVNRKDFGINWNKALDQGGFLLGDEVTINIQIEADQI